MRVSSSSVVVLCMSPSLFHSRFTACARRSCPRSSGGCPVTWTAGRTITSAGSRPVSPAPLALADALSHGIGLCFVLSGKTPVGRLELWFTVDVIDGWYRLRTSLEGRHKVLRRSFYPRHSVLHHQSSRVIEFESGILQRTPHATLIPAYVAVDGLWWVTVQDG